MSDSWSQRRKDKTNRAGSNRAAAQAEREAHRAAILSLACDCECHSPRKGVAAPHYQKNCICRAMRQVRSGR